MPFHAAYVFDDVDYIYWAHEWLMNNIINEHAPVKEKTSKPRKPAYMNNDLRRAIFKKKYILINIKLVTSALTGKRNIVKKRKETVNKALLL